MALFDFRRYVHSHGQFFKYALISVIGLIITSTIFYTLQIYSAVSVFSSNLLGDLAAITFVFTLSWRRIFVHNGRWVLRKYLMSSAAKLATIFFLSFLLTVADTMLDQKTMQLLHLSREVTLTTLKVLLAPVTLVLNYTITKFFIQK